MYATMDISSGKADNDKSPMVIWRGLQIVGIELFSGEPNEMAGWIKTKLKFNKNEYKNKKGKVINNEKNTGYPDLGAYRGADAYSRIRDG